MKLKLLLVLETSGAGASVVLAGSDVFCSRQQEDGGFHANGLLTMIDSVLTEEGSTLSSLGGIAVVCGPGNFTGLRVGMAIAQGFAFAAQVPILSISSLLLLAEGAFLRTGVPRVACAIEACRGSLYYAVYERSSDNRWQPSVAEQVIAAGQLAASKSWLIHDTVCAGRGWQKLREWEQLSRERNGHYHCPHAKEMVALADQAPATSWTLVPEALQPNYLRNDVAHTILLPKEASRS